MLLGILLSISSFAQKSEDYVTLQSYVDLYTQAIKESNFEKIAMMTHPNIVKMGGGQEFMVNELSSENEMYNGLNLRLLNIKTNSTSKIISAGEELHAIVPYIIEYQNGEESYEEENFFLAASLDNGTSWYFVDYKKYDPESIKVFLPNYNERLNIFLKSSKH